MKNLKEEQNKKIGRRTEQKFQKLEGQKRADLKFKGLDKNFEEQKKVIDQLWKKWKETL